MTEEYNRKLAAEMARASLTAGKYPFELCGSCESKVLELLASIHMDELLNNITDRSPAEPPIERLDLHRWLANHRAENGHQRS